MTLTIVIGVLCYLLFGHGFSKWIINLRNTKLSKNTQEDLVFEDHKQGIYMILFVLWPVILSLLMGAIFFGSIKSIFK
jgi:hypothetical protein